MKTSLPVIVKLIPNVTDIALLRKREKAGAECYIINQYFDGMSVDFKKQESRI